MSARTKADNPPPLNVVLKTLVAQRNEIDQTDDTISGLIQRIQSVLKSSVSTRVSIEMDVDPTDGTINFLTFGKHDGHFLLIFENGRYDDDGDVYAQHKVPLLNTSREFRSRVFAEGHVETLIRSASDQVAVQIASRAKALEAAKRIADALDPLSAESLTAETTNASSDDDIPF
jgi:hypothetical protein